MIGGLDWGGCFVASFVAFGEVFLHGSRGEICCALGGWVQKLLGRWLYFRIIK